MTPYLILPHFANRFGLDVEWQHQGWHSLPHKWYNYHGQVRRRFGKDRSFGVD